MYLSKWKLVPARWWEICCDILSRPHALFWSSCQLYKRQYLRKSTNNSRVWRHIKSLKSCFGFFEDLVIGVGQTGVWQTINIFFQLHLYRCKSKEELLTQIKRNFPYVSILLKYCSSDSCVSADRGEEGRSGLHSLQHCVVQRFSWVSSQPSLRSITDSYSESNTRCKISITEHCSTHQERY